MKNSLLLVGLFISVLILSGCISSEPMIKISKEEALKIATDNEGNFLGTWITTNLKNGNWHISAFSKSAKPPIYYVINGDTGEIIYKNLNTDTQKIPKEYTDAPITDA